MIFFIIFVMIVAYSFQSLFYKLFSNNYKGKVEISANLYSVFFGGIIGSITLLMNGFSYDPSGITITLGVANAIMLFMYNLSLLKASNLGSYMFTMISMLFGGLFIPMLASVVFLSQKLSSFQVVGVIFMFLSLILINFKKSEKKTPISRSFIIWCIIVFLSNGLYGSFMSLQSNILRGEERSEMIITSYFLSAIFAVLYLFLKGARGNAKSLISYFSMNKVSLLFILISCIVATLAANLMLYSLSLVNTTVLCAVNNGGVLTLSALYSFILFKEKLSRVRVFGIIVSLLSIVLLCF